MNVESLSQEIFSRYGEVKRARGSFLYTAKNVRLTDLFLEDARALLGWGAGSSGTMLKNVLSRGACGSYVTGAERKLDKAVSELFVTSRKAFIFNDFDDAVNFTKSISKDYYVFVPWNQEEEYDFKNGIPVVFKPVFPWASDIFIVAVDEENLNIKKEEIPSDELNFKSAGIKIASPLSAAITRSVYDLIKALQERSEKDWFRFDKIISKYWERKGPYLYAKVPEENYDKFVLFCLDNGIIINPCHEGKSVVPYGVADSIFDCFKKNEFNW